MGHRKFFAGTQTACAAAAAIALLLAGAGCGLDKSPQPDLQGPSTTGVSVDLRALPDVLNADGVSQTQVRLVLHDNTGRPIVGQAVLFQTDGDGTMGPSPASTYVGPVQTGIVMASDKDGTAYVVYTAGTSIRVVTFIVRPYGIDTTYTFEKSIEIHQQ
ncbi:MAG TPA: hypothetical protein VL691_19195 [Vicinamibacteria bacterium]|nr:hypothetical protein [Vicinamibacteria bacterium]